MKTIISKYALESYTGSILRCYSGQQLQVKGQKEVQILHIWEQLLKLPVVVIASHKTPALLECDLLSNLRDTATQTTSRPAKTDVSKVQPSFSKGNRHHCEMPGRHKVE